MKKIVRKLQKAKVPASDIKEMDLSNWEAERTARGEPTQSANIDDRRKEKSISDAGDGRRMQQSLLDKDNESEPKSDSSNITSKNITSRENPNPEPLKPMSDFVSRSINSPIRSERSMPGPYRKYLERADAARRARGLDEEAPANAAGGGEVAGLGVGLQGEPGVYVSKQRKHQRANKKGEEERELELNLFRRNAVVMEMRKRTISDKAIADAATKGDKALDKNYGYGTVKGGVSPLAFRRRQQGFGSMANFNSARAAIISKLRGANPKSLDTAIHKGWGKTVDQMPAPNPEKQAARKKLQKTPFYALSKDEQEKDTVLRKGALSEGSEKMKTLEGEPVKAFVVEKGKFAGSTTFIVPSNVFQEARMQKKSGKHWRTYIGEEDYWRPIREYANKNPKRAIVLQCEKTGAMCYARYGGKHDNKRDS